MRIDTFRPEHSRRFAVLNREWLIRYDLLEPADEAQLADPEGHFLATGGQIFVALDDREEVVGTCAVVPHGEEGECEIAKLAVDPAARGRGIARQLVECCLTWARAMGFRRAILVSNHQLLAARALYESVGFEYGPVPPLFSDEYATADIFMSLDLAAAPASPSGAFRTPG